MRRWSFVCGAALLALSLTGTAHADEWNKLTYLTFSGPVQLPGVTLPAGTYRFQLADPDSSRRVVRVSDKDGSTSYGIFPQHRGPETRTGERSSRDVQRDTGRRAACDPGVVLPR